MKFCKYSGSSSGEDFNLGDVNDNVSSQRAVSGTPSDCANRMAYSSEGYRLPRSIDEM